MPEERSPRIGFVGLGLMGFPMASNLLSAGFPVTGWNRSEPAVAKLVARGGAQVDSVAALVDVQVLIFMLPDLGYIEAAAEPLLAAWRVNPPAVGTLVIVMSSVSPVRVRKFGALVHTASGGHATVIDAPVSGGTTGARAGTLAIMVGSEPEEFDRIAPVLGAMGGTVRRMGALGAGSLAKACNQLVVGTTTAALAEVAELADRSGLDVSALFEVLAGGLANSTVLGNVGPRLAAKDYTPTGPAKFMLKDLTFVLETATGNGTDVPLATAARQIYATLTEQGLGDLDLAVVRESISRRSAAQGS